MRRLFMALYAMGGPTLAGSGVVAMLATGNDTWKPIVIAAAAGAVLALPLCWALARKLWGA
jgi:hypothetical protein